MTWSEARELVSELARAATGSSPEAWTAGGRRLEGLDGRSWLLVDDAAHSSSYAAAVPVSGRQGWSDVDLGEPTGFVAAVASLQTDGHLRQRATSVLVDRGGPVSRRALAVRLLDHVPQVRDEARRALLTNLTLDDADGVLGVLLAGSGRQHGLTALTSVRDVLLERSSAAEVVETLMRSDDRAVRRWAFREAHDQDVLTPERMLGVLSPTPTSACAPPQPSGSCRW